jgi:acetyl esterase/lipase
VAGVEDRDVTEHVPPETLKDFERAARFLHFMRSASAFFFSLLVAVTFGSPSLWAENERRAAYEPAIETLAGTIVEERLSEDEDTPPLDRGKVVWILRLDRPVFVPGKAGDEIDVEEKSVTEIHLNVEHAKFPIAKEAFGKKRFVTTGTLYHAHTAHHQRAIVMMVSDLKPAEQMPWPVPGLAQLPIWPAAAPDATQPAPMPENETKPVSDLIAGRPWTQVTNVAQPTMTVYPPKGANTGIAVVVFPGGGYRVLAIDLEGTEVCEWLASKGITAVLLKYRVPFSGQYWDPQLRKHVQPKAPQALQDAQRTLGLVRARAAEWKIDPRKIGVLGFSAGGHIVAEMSTRFKERVYPAVDEADKVSCRPDFAVALYPGHLWVEDEEEKFELNPTIAKHLTKETPPTFLLQAEDDRVDDANHSLIYYRALKEAKVPVEMHLYAQGGHGFGLRRTRLPITAWPELVEKWLRTIGVLAE